ncbi:MAG: YebC/PmpR family DNA-binding transcriptional regulator, partial [bacterium]|nr:YebC/PmpR family DNA-binding transcriptional regulator [bacterium]
MPSRDEVMRAGASESDTIISMARMSATGWLGSTWWTMERMVAANCPGGVAVLIETLSDNRNRTVGDVRHAFVKHGGNLGANGCVAYLFEKKGLI